MIWAAVSLCEALFVQVNKRPRDRLSGRSFFKTLTCCLSWAVSCRRQSSVSAPSARQTRAARARAAASTRSCPPREFHEVAGTARGATLALGAVPRGLGPCEAEPPRARESGNASGRGVVHGAGMRALRAAAYVKKRRNCSLVGGGEASMHSRGSLAVAEEQDDSVPSPPLQMASGL